MKVKGLGYLTQYDFKLNGYYIVRNGYNVCFSTLFNMAKENRRSSGYLRVLIYDTDCKNKIFKDNYCITSKYHVRKYVKWISEMSGVKLKILSPRKSDISNGFGTEGFFIKAIFENNSAYEIMLVATMIRLLYEMPFSFQLKTATLMSRLKEFKHLDFSERLCVAINSMSNCSFREVHSPFKTNRVKLVNNNDVFNRYTKLKKSNNDVSSFYETHERSLCRIMIDESINQDIVTEITSNKINKDFKKILLNNYNSMK